MFPQWFFILLLNYVILSDGCVSYNFEEGYLERFNQFPSICSGFPSWHFGYYSSLGIDKSRGLAFITPREDFSCVTSFKFYFQRSGTLEVNVYMNGAGDFDEITVQPYVANGTNGNDPFINSVSVITINMDFTPGWQKIKMDVKVPEPHPGYVTFMGRATEPSSIVLVDSFRYIPSTLDEEECQIYKDIKDKDNEEDKKPKFSFFYMFKMGIIKNANVIFQEIAFKAELDRHVDPESEYQASILCGEDFATRADLIEQLKNIIYERGECRPPRMDDAFLLRFLRARRCIPARAHRLMVRYCRFRDQNPHLWRGVYWYSLTRLGNAFEGVLFDRPDVGRLIICRLGQWDPDLFPVDDLIRGCLLLLEVGIMQPKLQILGGTALLDCEGISMKHMRQLSPSIAIQAMNVMGFSFPLHQRGLHIVNCSRVFEKLFYVFRRFAPADELWRRVFFHGYEYTSLHRYIDPECLPTRYGGLRQSVSLKDWLHKIHKYKDKQFDDDISSLGYGVD